MNKGSEKKTKKDSPGKARDTTTENSNHPDDKSVDVVFRASKVVALRENIKMESQKYFHEKDLILREIQIFEMNPSNMGPERTNQLLRDLREILKRRNTLHSREVSLLEDIDKIERMTGQAKNASHDRKLLANVRSNLEDAMGQVAMDIRFIEKERTNIMNDFKELRTYEYGGTPLNEYSKYGFTPQGAPDPNLRDEGPTLAMDAMKITEFLNKNYDRLYTKNPKLAKELEAIVKYLQGGDFTRQYDSPDAGDVQRGLDKIAAKKTHHDFQRARKIEKQNKAQALKDYKDKLERAGKEVMNLDYEQVKMRSKAADRHVYQGGFDDFTRESPMHQAVYGNPERDALEGLLSANQKMMAQNGITASLMKREVESRQDKAYEKNMLELELAKRKAQLEKEKMELEIMKTNQVRNKKPIESKIMLNAMSNFTDTMGVMQNNYSNILKEVMQVCCFSIGSRSNSNNNTSERR